LIVRTRIGTDGDSERTLLGVTCYSPYSDSESSLTKNTRFSTDGDSARPLI